MVAMLSATPAYAALPEQARIAWVRGEGAESCPDETAILAQVERRLANADEGLQARSVEGIVRRSAAEVGWTAVIYVRDETGASFITTLRHHGTFRRMPIVGMSVGGNQVRTAMLEAGADLFLHKPIVLKDLFCTLEFLMDAGSKRGAA